MTLAVNTGTLITYDRDALRRWQSRHRGRPSREQAIAAQNRLAAMFPGMIQVQ